MNSTRLHGWNDAALDNLEDTRGWTPEAIARLELSWDEKRDRVCLPVRDQSGDHLGDLRYDPTGQRNPKMIADNGVPRELFPPPEMIDDDEPNQRTLWLVEGEPDAVRAWSLGLPAVAVPGAAAWRPEWAARFTGRHWRVAICFDCDQAGRKAAARAADDLTHSGVDVRVVDLDVDRDDGFDLTDWTRSADTPPLRQQAASALQSIAKATTSHVPGSGSKPPGDTAPEPPGASQSAVEAIWLSAREFAEQEEDLTEPLIGNPDDMLLPQAGLLIMYGDGGAGKTTLTLDAMCHLGSGTPWLGQPVPVPLRILLIENEGPRGMMQKRFAARLQDWDGEPWEERVDVWTHPWGGFTFRDEWCRQNVADRVTSFEADLVMVGPLAAIGAIGGGTPDDVTEFAALLADTQKRTPLPFAYWVIHHENKAGDVSGAWERLPDTLVHVSGQGNGHTRVHWRKARWSSLHDTSMNLSWAGTYSFTLDDPPPTEDDIKTQVRELYETEDKWRTADEVRQSLAIGLAKAKRVLDELTTGGTLVEMVGPPGRNARSRCWRLASGTDAPTLGELENPVHPSSPEFTHEPAGTGGSSPPPTPPPEGGLGGGTVHPPRDTTGEPDPDPDSDIPF